MSVVLSLLLLGLSEHAEPVESESAVSLRWQAPSECMDRDNALVRLYELMPGLPEHVPDNRGKVEVEVEITDGAGLVRFISEQGIEERTFEGQTCESVAAAVLLVIAITVDPVTDANAWHEPDAAEPEPEKPEEIEEPAEPKPARAESPPTPSIEPPTREPEPGPKVRGHVGLLGGGGYGPINAGMGALALELGVSGKWWRAAARGIWVPPRTLALEQDPGSSGRYDGGFGGARGCVVPPLARGRLELPVCAGIEAGVLRGRGVGSTPQPTGATQPWVAVEVGPGLRYVPNRWIALGLELDVVAALLRGGFKIGGEIAQNQAPVGVRALAGLEIRFP